MNGSGCKNCPVNPCHTLYYRGSYCCEQRAKHGLGDPMTNADRIRSMTDEELAAFLCKEKICTFCFCDDFCAIDGVEGNGLLKWLQQPAEGK